jgi:hypothetical protein
MYESEAQENRSWKEHSCTPEKVRARGTELDADNELRHVQLTGLLTPLIAQM